MTTPRSSARGVSTTDGRRRGRRRQSWTRRLRGRQPGRRGSLTATVVAAVLAHVVLVAAFSPVLVAVGVVGFVLGTAAAAVA